ncbi:MAG TPA: glycoside hydrolase family 3 N-terminal domain-containing protein [Sphingomonas sp.]|uniref:glycoside hydrolase family 3 protein n=1 Tax=Sphingomonas sp. TaxID=28214 RepID=UPI002B7690A9|nr:glycoside hydrolase family 3 N-terminal domain-containing protein [Sphingomonas sp.]HMI18286.1 glycoside hydrolase family 3 N-terminal domain-containing protein [Sphingomonas sp.]
MMRDLKRLAVSGLAIALATATTAQPATERGVAHPALWPMARSQGLVDPKTEAFVSQLMAKMTLEEKVGQMVQGDISTIRPNDLRTYPLGSILAGGSSPPLDSPDRSPAAAWLATSRAFNAVANETRPGHTTIPIIFGIDAVHGNANIVGATVFPHNIGLGAMHDPALMTKIGRATAEETAAAGIDWAFGPTLTVPQDERWGRAYEGYSEDPAVVASYAGAMVEGLQGPPGKGTLQQGYVAASAKHFLGDGGTIGGVDQGDADIPESELIRIHNGGYPNAIDAGVMSVMASFSMWQGVKMHGNKSLLTDVLKGRMGFDGFVVGDWNAHGQVPGCTTEDCPVSFNAGLDMAMAPDGWKALFHNTVAEVKAGKIPMARVDDAVRRILRVKVKLGLFDPARPYAGRLDVVGAPEHRVIARQAVAESLVLLKNNGVLPLKASAHILVAGADADDIGQQSGGWTLSWQGDGNTNADFPGGTSLYAGIAAAMKAAGGSATLSPDGSYTAKPDVAVVIFGEQPYAEMRGDIRTMEFQAGDKQALALLKKFKAAGIPVVSVFLSGRPLWVNPEINASDAFVAAWLPGSEGGGVADVLIGDAAGKPRHDFHGTLSFSWPRTAGQFTLNPGEKDYDPLFPLGYGLTYAHGGTAGALSEVSGVDPSLGNTSTFFAKGQVPAPFTYKGDPQVVLKPVNSATLQEGAAQLTWPAGQSGTVGVASKGMNLLREVNADVQLQITYRVDRAPTAPVKLTLGNAAVDASLLFAKAGPDWRTIKVPLRCFRDHGGDMANVMTPFALGTTGPFTVSISELRLAADPAGSICPK